ncbi:glycosyltransferase [Methyloceanibacter sp. wino2]|uniref:glycosyltransferase n=1 Tax=Methyloceanibacter sp. wino2 TaxID=2170729 RepID=UPI00131F08BA|nr:glycosyltransferase [Methyloceanibacter sp. wino2]
MPSRSVSIVVPVYNELSHTLSCIAAIRKNTAELDYEIILVDDCSTDGTQAAFAQSRDLLYVRNEKNLGFIGSCNAGAKKARKTYICFLNNDTSVRPYWLSALVNTFELHENVGLAGSKLVYPDGRLQEAGGLVWEDGSAWNWGRFQDPHDPRYNYARHADFCSGASILLPRRLFESVGGFDTLYTPAYAEDVDLAFKVRALGLSTIYQPLSQVLHFEGVSSGTDTSQGIKKYQVENLVKLAARWAPALVGQGYSEDADRHCDRGVVGRILVVDQITPEPDRDAGSVALLEVCLALRDLGYKITFMPSSNLCDMPPYTDLLGALGMESVLLPWAKSVGDHLRDHGSSYDAVIVSRPDTWFEHIDDIRSLAPQAKIVYDACDLHFLRHQREAETVASASMQAKDELEIAKRAELDLIASADVGMVHSSAEKALVEQERPNARVVVVPIIHEPRGKGKPMEERSGIVFLGGYRHPPNVDAVEYYLSEIHPAVKEGIDEPVVFTAAGNAPPAAFEELASAEILVPGYVEDLEPLLYNARLMVAPLRYGAGVKGKILSAMAHGLPVVTTSIGAEGISDQDDMLVADDPKSFAEAVCRLYSDRELWHRLQGAGLAFLEKNTSCDVALRIMGGVLEQLGLPYLRWRVPEAAQPGGASNFGTPTYLSDVRALVGAGRRLLMDTDNIDLVILPDGVAAPQCDWTPIMAHRSGCTERLRAARSIVAIADAADEKATEALGRDLSTSLGADANCAVVFAPPRVTAGPRGYAIKAPFRDTEVQDIHLPFHESLGDHFNISTHTCSWHIDKSLTGFPSIAVLRIGA